MEGPLKERDWKYMRSIHDEMLHQFCADINRGAVEIASATVMNPHEQYLALYRHIQESDAIVADCFNDWSRGRLPVKVLQLRHHGLLTNQQIENLSPEARDWLREMEKSGKCGQA